LRPTRLFGFDGTTDEDPRSPTGFKTLRGTGLSSATAPVILTDEVDFKLQGVLKWIAAEQNADFRRRDAALNALSFTRAPSAPPTGADRGLSFRGRRSRSGPM